MSDSSLPAPAHACLSARELEVLRFIGEGKTVSEIAAVLGLSVKTVSTYRGRLLEKLDDAGVLEGYTTSALIRYAFKERLVQ